MQRIPKPGELLALHDVTEELFDLLGAWFEVPDRVAISLGDVDAAAAELSDPVMIAAMAMRKLQALRLLATPGVPTTTDVVVTIVQDLDRALVQAPALRLRRAAAEADWDGAMRELVAGAAGHPPEESTDRDVEVERFRDLHGRLHEAQRAVIEASDGQIRELV